MLREKWIRREPLPVRRLRVFFESLARQRLWEHQDVDVPGLPETTLVQITEMRPMLVEWLNLLGEAAQAEQARRPKPSYGLGHRSQASAPRPPTAGEGTTA